MVGPKRHKMKEGLKGLVTQRDFQKKKNNNNKKGTSKDFFFPLFPEWNNSLHAISHEQTK